MKHYGKFDGHKFCISMTSEDVASITWWKEGDKEGGMACIPGNLALALIDALGERADALRDAVEAVKAALTDDDGYVRQSELDDAVAAIEALAGGSNDG